MQISMQAAIHENYNHEEVLPVAQQERLPCLSKLKKDLFFRTGKLTRSSKFCLFTLSVGRRERLGGGMVF